jgi:hypothetical protein
LINSHKTFIDLLSETLFYREAAAVCAKEKTQNASLSEIMSETKENNSVSATDYSEFEIYKTVYFKYQ